MNNLRNDKHCFVFLQGPHGPFFAQLAKMLRHAGARCIRVGFNRGDQAFWSTMSDYIAFRHDHSAWPETFERILTEHHVTDLVLYGDTRAIHAQAIEIAKARGIKIHVFEEGYLRPYWVTYERNGSNGHSRLMDMTLQEMQDALKHSDLEVPLPPSHWGDTRHHVFYGALYHWFVMFANWNYPNFKPHRSVTVAREFQLYVKGLLMMPIHRLHRFLTTYRITQGGFPYHLVLLQLEHDAAFQKHSPFTSMKEFLGVTIEPEVAQITVIRGNRREKVWFQDLFQHPEMDIALRGGDRILVESDTRAFTVLGAAGSQARVSFPTQTISAIEALALVGGLSSVSADPKGVFVFRNEPADIANQVMGRTGLKGAQRMVYVLDLTKPNGVFNARDFVIRDQDTVYVTEAPFTQWNKTIGAITGTLGSAQGLANSTQALSGN
ncbi:MAG: hypothetical protein EBU18_10700 [Rhodobacteraceae bacterium]|nr:hypothetical protein [Paracoccaceae bacterium]